MKRTNFLERHRKWDMIDVYDRNVSSYTAGWIGVIHGPPHELTPALVAREVKGPRRRNLTSPSFLFTALVFPLAVPCLHPNMAGACEHGPWIRYVSGAV